MGYRIVYGKKKARFRQPTRGKKVLVVAVVVCILSVAFGILSRTELLTGNWQASGAALEHLVDAVHNGESFSDAVVTFCQEIIANAQISN